MDISAKPVFPISRFVRETDDLSCHCPVCGSSMMFKRFFFFGARPGCIQPECSNYGKKVKS